MGNTILNVGEMREKSGKKRAACHLRRISAIMALDSLGKK